MDDNCGHSISPLAIEAINNKSELIVVLLGKKAQEWKKYLKNQTIIEVEHPAAAAYKGGIWNDKDLFINVNKLLESQGKALINW